MPKCELKYQRMRNALPRASACERNVSFHQMYKRRYFTMLKNAMKFIDLHLDPSLRFTLKFLLK